MVAVARTGIAYVSTNGGTTWTPITVTSATNLEGAAISADGQTMLLSDYAGRIFTSTNAGSSWTQQTATGLNSLVVDMTPDGTKMVAADDDTGGSIFISEDSGVTWVPQAVGGGKDWSWISMSDDGLTIIASTFGDYVYVSRDGGDTWEQQTDIGTNSWWSSVAVSGDGLRLLAIPSDDQPFRAVLGATTTAPPSGGGVGGQNASAGGSVGTLANTGADLRIYVSVAIAMIMVGLISSGRMLIRK
jgi:hypothetical protein